MTRFIFIAMLVLMGGIALASDLSGPVGGWTNKTLTGSNSSVVIPQPTGDILLVDGTSLILQTDGASLICRAGGC
jgi:hypothetical protein